MFRPFRRHRIRRRIALLALLALLFQQLALVAYACPLMVRRDVTQNAVSTMAGMSMSGMHRRMYMPGCRTMTPAAGTALCITHCAQPVPAPQDARVPAVPALALPPQPPVLTAGAVLLRPVPPEAQGPALGGAPPPPRSLVLLI